MSIERLAQRLDDDAVRDLALALDPGAQGLQLVLHAVEHRGGEGALALGGVAHRGPRSLDDHDVVGVARQGGAPSSQSTRRGTGGSRPIAYDSP